MRVVVINHLTLDGVLQGPGRPDEDTRHGFRHGGWATARSSDPTIGSVLAERMSAGFSWLFGRRSYQDMLGHWNETGGPFKDGLNQTTKYVASSDGDLHLRWPNSVLLTGDVPAVVAELRQRPGGNLVVMGSGQLVRSLLPHRLVDEMLLMIHPVLLGSGERLFGPSEEPTQMRLVDSSVTSTGVSMTTYRPEPRMPESGQRDDRAARRPTATG